MVHRVYMCSNLKSPLVVQEFDQVEGCNNINHILSTSPSFVLKKQVNFQEGKRYWLLPTTCPPTKLKPRTVCCQEGEDDEDMTPSDTTIAYKVQIFLKVQVHQNCYVIVTGLLFTIGTLAQVRAHPMKLENISRRSLDVLHLGHLLRRPARASNPSWRPNRI